MAVGILVRLWCAIHYPLPSPQKKKKKKKKEVALVLNRLVMLPFCISGLL